MVALCLAAYGDVCHLCGHAGAESADHVRTRAEAPWLTWELANLRPVHHAPCPTCRQRCNPVRGTRPLPTTRPTVLDARDYVD